MPDTVPEIVLIDDDASFLRAISRQIGLLGFTATPFTDAGEGIGHVRAGRGDCLIVDLHMPQMSGLDVQNRLAGLPLPVIFLSGQATIPSTVQAIRNGAVNFLEKPVEFADLSGAVAAALTHRARMLSDMSANTSARARFGALTGRQQEVFRVLITGASNKAIARELGIGERTVKAHRHAIMERLQAETIADVYKLATELGEPLSNPG